MTSARARATRCCMPPESCRGFRCSVPARSTRRRISCTRPATWLRATFRGEARDVLEDRQVREERVALEDRVHVALVRRKAGDGPVAEVDDAIVRLLEAADHAQRRRLAAAGRSEQAKKEPRGISTVTPSTATTSSKRFVTRSSRTSATAVWVSAVVVAIRRPSPVGAAAVWVPPVLRREGGLEVDVLRLLKGLEALLAELPSQTGLLHPAEGTGVVVGQGIVEPDGAGLQLAHAAEDGVEILGVDVGAEPEPRPVRELDCLVQALDRDERRDRAEGLLPQEVGLGRAPVTTVGA